ARCVEADEMVVDGVAARGVHDPMPAIHQRLQAFNKDLLPALPPFAVGRLTWDNWLLYEAKRREIPLIDASRVVLAIHQNHNYSYDKRLTRGGWNWEHPEVKANLALAGGQEHTRGIHDSDFVLGAVGVWPAWGREH